MTQDTGQRSRTVFISNSTDLAGAAQSQRRVAVAVVRSTCFMGMSVTTTPHTCIGAGRKWAGARTQRCGSDKDGGSRLVHCRRSVGSDDAGHAMSRRPAESGLGDGTAAMAWHGRGMVPLHSTNHRDSAGSVMTRTRPAGLSGKTNSPHPH